MTRDRNGVPWTPEEIAAAADRFRAEDPAMHALVVALYGTDFSPWVLVESDYLRLDVPVSGALSDRC